MRLSIKRTPLPTPEPEHHVQIRFELGKPLVDGTPVCQIAVQRPDGTWVEPIFVVPGERLDVTVHLP
jgi:hypothetical protein